MKITEEQFNNAIESLPTKKDLWAYSKNIEFIGKYISQLEQERDELKQRLFEMQNAATDLAKKNKQFENYKP